MAETVSDATKERITVAAVEAVRHAPVATLTVAEVAGAAGVTSSSIYKAYANKYELFAEASRRVMVDQIVEVAEEVDEALSPTERLRQVLEGLVRTCAAEPFAVAYLYGLFPAVHHGDVDSAVLAKVEHVDAEVRTRLRHRVAEAVATGDLQGDPDQLTELCRYAAFGYLGDAVNEPPRVSPEDFAAFVLAGMTATPRP